METGITCILFSFYIIGKFGCVFTAWWMEIILVSVAWSGWEYFYSCMDGMGGGGGTCRIHDGGLQQTVILQPPRKILEPETNYLASKFSTPKKYNS